jgi:formamidase
MPRARLAVDPRKAPEEQSFPIHNRFHPEIPPIMTVKPGEVFRVECLDWTGGQIGNNDSAEDINQMNLQRVHCLTGPIAVQGAMPGDLLVVDILDLGPLPDWEWGFTGIFSRTNGGGFLTDRNPEARKAIWDFQGIFATSRHLPGVRFAGITHPGIVAVAPSMKMLEAWNARERTLIDLNPMRIPPIALPPEPSEAMLGNVPESERTRIAAEAARTVPPRENGGNCDIKNLTRGSRIFFPVHVEGANLSIGDIHFSQGDGEITFCGGIEIAGYVDLHVDLIRGGAERYGGLQHPIFQTGPMEPQYSDYLVFEGISVDEQGRQYYLDAHIAYRRACVAAIEYLASFGYTEEQVYLLLGAAPVEGRISGLVDIPNACCTLYIPTAIFDFDIRPSASGPQVVQRGQPAR